MKYKILSALCISLLMVTASAQDKDKKEEKKESKETKKSEAIDKEPSGKKTPGNVYAEILIEDFENSNYTDSNLHFIEVKENQKGSLKIRDEFPAPTMGSKKYLGLKVYGRSGDSFTITPPKDIIIDKLCKSINVWVYGKNFTGTLSMLIEDSEKNAHKILFGKLNFLGWNKLTYKLPEKLVQEDEFLNQKKSIKLLKIIYEPGNSRNEMPKWQTLYIDDISASVREKYSDRQNDDW